MGSHGRDLWNKLEKLNVNFGNLGINVVEAWFDTDNKELVDFLNFITNYISDQNALTTREVVKYSDLKVRDKVLCGVEYDKEVRKVSARYPGIFELEQNIFEIVILENERNYVVEYKSYLDDVVNVMRKDLERIENLFYATDKESLNSRVNLEKEYDVCLNHSSILDEINRKLCEHLHFCELYVTPNYISVNSDECVHFNYIINLLNLMDTQEFNDLTMMYSMIKTRKLQHDNINNLFDRLKDRVFKSTDRRYDKEILLAKLRGELKFINNFNVMSLISSTRSYGETSMKLSLTADIYSIEEIFKMRILDFENNLSQITTSYINNHYLISALDNLCYIKSTLNYFRHVKKSFITIFSFDAILYSLFVANISHLKTYYEIFRTAHKCVINDVQRCNFRIEAMANIIEEQEQHKKLPIQQINSLINSLIQFLSSGDPNRINLKSACNLVYSFNKECQDIEKKLFVDEPRSCQKLIRDLDTNTKVLTKFLSNGPTSEFISLQYRLCKIFREIDDFLKSQNASVRANVALLTKTTKQISNDEWLKYKRLLWMYFLLEPKKVQRIINKIKEETSSRIKENLK